jgi:bifunctional N-acetylglucosamine-1-phosphate-uridyltransferase/glucosamine-1-phosphate-acetyltransferase GlmU-like protein
MAPLLIIPAAGLGSRLGASSPKVLVPVAGVPMLDRLLDLYRAAVDRVVLVVGPGFLADVERHLARRPDRARIDCVVQASPTGMLDAILLAMPVVDREGPSSVWVTWCDQVAVHPRTVERLQALTSGDRPDALVLPTVTRQDPYIHLERNSAGRIIRVRHRREGDSMPAVGESDMGLFAMSPVTYRVSLPAYAAEVEIGQATGERNFLPFIPWIARTGEVATFPCEDPVEAVGVNTPEELALVERHLTNH